MMNNRGLRMSRYERCAVPLCNEAGRWCLGPYAYGGEDICSHHAYELIGTAYADKMCEAGLYDCCRCWDEAAFSHRGEKYCWDCYLEILDEDARVERYDEGPRGQYALWKFKK